jgi:hypothetical protein
LEIFPQKIGERLEKRNVKMIFRHINYCIWSQNHIFVNNLLGKNIFQNQNTDPWNQFKHPLIGHQTVSTKNKANCFGFFYK